MSGGGGHQAGSGGTGGEANTSTTSPWNTCARPLPPAPPSDEPSSWVLALDGLATRWGQAYCAYQSRCSYFFAQLYGRLPGSCETRFAREFANLTLPPLLAGIEGDRTFYDAEGMEACLEAMTSAPCHEVDPSCKEALGGLVPDGGACLSSFECAGEASCKVSGQCPGVCVPVDERVPTQAEGTPCDDARCLPGLVCLHERLVGDPIPGMPTERSTCVVPGKANEVCPGHGEMDGANIRVLTKATSALRTARVSTAACLQRSRAKPVPPVARLAKGG